jgi:anti-anti-sigma regulatory factor
VLNKGETVCLKLEGKLAHEWVEEAERAWLASDETNLNRALIVDLHAVSFVDDPGRGLLAAMHHAGAELIGSGPMMSALIEEIEAAESLLRSRAVSLDSATAEWDINHDAQLFARSLRRLPKQRPV